MAPLETVTAGWYNLFYTLAVAVAGWATLTAGRRRGWTSTGWTIAVGTWVAAGVVGAMVPHLIFGDAIAQRTSVGATILATLTLAVAARLMGRGTAEVLDTTAIAIPIGAAVVRIGCFLADCCEGVVTSLPVGIALHEGDLVRHPVQLYESFLEAGLAFALTRRGNWSRPGHRFASSIAGMCAIRFATEFVRDNEKYSGFSLAQWVVLPIGALCVVVLLTAPRTMRPRRVLTATARRTTIGLVGGLGIATVAVGLPALEATVLLLGAAVVLALVIQRMGRIAPTGLAVLALQMPPISADTTYPRRYVSIGGGFNSGTWDEHHRYSDCEGTTVEDWTRAHSAQGMSAEIGMREQHSASKAVGVRVRGVYGVHNLGRAIVSSGSPSSPEPHTRTNAGFSVIGDADWKYFGLSFGLNAGQFYPMDEVTSGPGGRTEPLGTMAAVGLRVGRLDGLSAELRVADEAPSWAPAPIATMAIGLGDKKGNRIRAGVAETGLFISGKHVTPRGIEIAPMFTLGSGDMSVKNVIYGGIMVRKWIRVAAPPRVER